MSDFVPDTTGHAELRMTQAALKKLVSGDDEMTTRIKAMLASIPDPPNKGTLTRATTLLRFFEADTREKVRALDKFELLRCPNMGHKTVDWVVTAVAGVPFIKKRPGKSARAKGPRGWQQKYLAMREACAMIQHEQHARAAEIRRLETHLADARNYNLRMSKTIQDLVAAYYRLEGKLRSPVGEE